METVILLAHRPHNFIDYPRNRQEYRMSAGAAMEVPEDIGSQVANVHPNKVCVLERLDQAKSHSCPVSEQVAREESEADHEMITDAPVDRAMKPEGRLSRQRRKKLKDARRRSRRARLATAHIP